MAKLLQTYATVKKGLQQYGDALLAGGEVTSLLLQDVRHFLQSYQQEVPQSLRQLALLLQSDEAQNVAASLITATAQVRVVRGFVELGAFFKAVLQLMLTAEQLYLLHGMSLCLLVPCMLPVSGACSVAAARTYC